MFKEIMFVTLDGRLSHGLLMESWQSRSPPTEVPVNLVRLPGLFDGISQVAIMKAPGKYAHAIYFPQ